MKKFEYSRSQVDTLVESNNVILESNKKINFLMESEDQTDRETRKDLIRSVKVVFEELSSVSDELDAHLNEALELIESTEVTSDMNVSKGILVETADEIELLDECFVRLPKRALRNTHKILVDRESLNALRLAIPKVKRKVKQNQLVIEGEIRDVINKINLTEDSIEDLVHEVNTAIEYVGNILEAYNDFDMSFLDEAFAKNTREKTLQEIMDESLL